MSNPRRRCEGRSSSPDGQCPNTATFVVRSNNKNAREHASCGRHVSRFLYYVLVPGRTATVTKLADQ